MIHLTTFRSMLRVNTATWAGAAWLVLQQFGIPLATQSARDNRIVRVEEATHLLHEAETLPDGRILTLSIDHPVESRRQDVRGAAEITMNPN